MRCTVVWKEEAEGELAELWAGTDDRAAVSAAANSLDRELGNCPQLLGESRSADKRVAFEPPLCVQCRIVEDDRLVEVLHVSFFPRKA